LPIQNWIDESKDFRQPALRYCAEGIFLCERIFAVAITNSEGKQVPVCYIGEQHVRKTWNGFPGTGRLSHVIPAPGCMESAFAY